MANNEDERILSIKVKYQDAINGILEYQNKLQALKKEQEKWKNEVVDGTKNFNEYNAAMADIKIQIRVLEKEARNNLKTQQENEGSLKSLRAELSNSTKAYDEMSRTEREGAKGKELQDHINAVTNELNEAEQKTQRFYRNVGRYEDSVKDALISLQKQIQEADKEYNKLVKTEGEHAKSTKKLKIAAGELSKFPEVRRDLALLVDKSVTFSSLRSNTRRMASTAWSPTPSTFPLSATPPFSTPGFPG